MSVGAPTYQYPYTDLVKRVDEGLVDHVMEVKRDDGVYRHLRFMPAPPKGSSYWFDLVTWPGVLVFNGDMGSWMFARVTDMFDFFGNDRIINPGYWGEKLLAHDGYRKFSPDALHKRVKEYVNEHPTVIEMTDDERAALWRDIETDVFDVAMDTASAHEALTDFVRRAPENVRIKDVRVGDRGWHYTMSGRRTSSQVTRVSENQVWFNESLTAHALDSFTYTREDQIVFEFVDSWDWELNDYTYQYLWACRAIQWGIGKYREQS